MTSPLDQYYRAKRRHERLTRLELARLEKLRQSKPDMVTVEIDEPGRIGEAVFIWCAVILIAALFSMGMA